MPAPPTDPRPALVIGCGYLGLRVATAWRASGRRVCALTRGRSAELSAAGIEPVVGDVCDPDSLRNLPAASTVLYAVGLDRRAGRPMREVYVDGLANVVAALTSSPLSPWGRGVGGEGNGSTPEKAPGSSGERFASGGLPLTRPAATLSPKGRGSESARFLYVSSTSVYGQTDGSVVTEDSPTNPVEDSGKIILDAEAVLRAAVPDAVVLRFAGIYGPDRVLRRQALLAGEPLVGDADKWLNLIHVADGVRAVLAAEARSPAGATYLVADGTPVRRRDFYTRAAELLGAPPARFDHRPADGEPNRRIDAGKIRTECGFAPEFPSYREGLVDSVGHTRSG